MIYRFLRREAALPQLLVLLALVGCVLYAGHTDQSLSEMIDQTDGYTRIAMVHEHTDRCMFGDPILVADT